VQNVEILATIIVINMTQKFPLILSHTKLFTLKIAILQTKPRDAAMLLLLRRTLRDAVTYCAFQNVRKGRRMRKEAGKKIAVTGSSYNGKLAYYFKNSYQIVQPV
jgi:hypothetical protein